MEVVDLCSGDGWFTLQIAKIAGHVTPIDMDSNFLALAWVRLADNGATNSKFIKCNAYDVDKIISQSADFWSAP